VALVTMRDWWSQESLARYAPSSKLGDVCPVRSAALWPLLEPQWKDPKKWWKELFLQRPYRSRYNFVCESLRHIYPGYFRDFDFQIAGQTVTLQIFTSRWNEKPIQIVQESTGFMMAFLSLCAVASGEPGGLVAIDEIESSLHPAAIERLFECIDEHAADNDLRVLLATHSPVVLDQLRDAPSSVFVMQPGEPSLPVAMDKLFNPEWLMQFSLGRLYTSLEYGAPQLPAGA
jgi:hypothetical protein